MDHGGVDRIAPRKVLRAVCRTGTVEEVRCDLAAQPRLTFGKRGDSSDLFGGTGRANQRLCFAHEQMGDNPIAPIVAETVANLCERLAGDLEAFVERGAG